MDQSSERKEMVASRAELQYLYFRTLTGLTACSLASGARAPQLPIYCRIRKPDCSARQVIEGGTVASPGLASRSVHSRIAMRQKPYIFNYHNS